MPTKSDFTVPTSATTISIGISVADKREYGKVNLHIKFRDSPIDPFGYTIFEL